MFTHLLAFIVGAALVYFLVKRAAPAAPSPSAAATVAPGIDPMRAPDLDLDAEILEYITDNQVFHINDVCRAIEHPKGARFVRAHFHHLMEQGKIRYRNMVYSI
ncbi:MAG: hypothetical protein H7067_15260 [Burkholderiales bacterium]|nr:hypothetical protein [Opitutaceae bacterium]